MDRELLIRRMVVPITVITIVIYAGIAIVLSLLALVSLADVAVLMVAITGSTDLAAGLLVVLHAILLTIIIVEILETVTVYFRTSKVQVRPILVAGLTAMVRRVLLLGVESVNTWDILATAVVIAVLTAAVMLVGKEETEKAA